MYSKVDSETESPSSGWADDDVKFRDNDEAGRGRFAVVRSFCLRTCFVFPTIHRYHNSSKNLIHFQMATTDQDRKNLENVLTSLRLPDLRRRFLYVFDGKFNIRCLHPTPLSLIKELIFPWSTPRSMDCNAICLFHPQNCVSRNLLYYIHSYGRRQTIERT